MLKESSTRLFANEREASLDSTVAMVEAVLIELGLRVDESRRQRAGTAASWSFHTGSTCMDIDLVEHPQSYRLRASATVMTIDEAVDRQALFARLLALNALEITGAAFALQDPEVLLLSERSSLNLDRGELRALIDTVRRSAGTYDAPLVEEFGGRRGRLHG